MMAKFSLPDRHALRERKVRCPRRVLRPVAIQSLDFQMIQKSHSAPTTTCANRTHGAGWLLYSFPAGGRALAGLRLRGPQAVNRTVHDTRNAIFPCPSCSEARKRAWYITDRPRDCR